MKFRKKGQVGGTISAIIMLIVGVAVSVMIMIFTGALSGQTYSLVEDDIDAITNTTIKTSVKAAIYSGFQAQEQTGNYLPLIVLAVIITLIMGMLLGFMAFTNVGGGGGTAL